MAPEQNPAIDEVERSERVRTPEFVSKRKRFSSASYRNSFDFARWSETNKSTRNASTTNYSRLKLPAGKENEQPLEITVGFLGRRPISVCQPELVCDEKVFRKMRVDLLRQKSPYSQKQSQKSRSGSLRNY